MQVITTDIPFVNRWDKDSIRPGPVGTVGDVNLQVQLKKSSPDMANRYDPRFSGKNEVWSGSNVSDGMWKGYTSGGRGAVVLKQPWNNKSKGKTAVGWRFENVMPTDRTTEPKMTPLGRYGWDTTVGSVLKAKMSGDLFLPLPEGYKTQGLPRGSTYPTIVASTTGAGETLPAADVPITDPMFGETGSIELPGRKGCTFRDLQPDGDGNPPIFTLAMDDPRRKDVASDEFFINEYKWRRAAPYDATKPNEGKILKPEQWPEVGESVWAIDKTDGKPKWRKFNHCARENRAPYVDESPAGCPPGASDPDANGLPSVWVPDPNSEFRKNPLDDDWFVNHYPWRKAKFDRKLGRNVHFEEYPEIGDEVVVFSKARQERDAYEIRKCNPCGVEDRHPNVPAREEAPDIPPIRIPRPGDQNKRRQDRKKEMEDEKKKKQKMR